MRGRKLRERRRRNCESIWATLDVKNLCDNFFLKGEQTTGSTTDKKLFGPAANVNFAA